MNNDNNAKPPLKIDDNLLSELGLAALPPQERSALLKHIYETLEMRVGMRLADQMTNEQLDEFEQYFNAQDDAGAFKWLETNFPNYKDIVAEEFEKLKGEVAQSAPQILAASQQGQATAGQQPAAGQYQQPPQAAQPQYAQQPAPDQYQQQPQYQQPTPGQYQQPAPAQPGQGFYQQPPQPQYQPQPEPQQYQQPNQGAYGQQPQQPQYPPQQPPQYPPQYPQQ